MQRLYFRSTTDFPAPFEITYEVADYNITNISALVLQGYHLAEGYAIETYT